jgi:hypothetical protein
MLAQFRQVALVSRDEEVGVAAKTAANMNTARPSSIAIGGNSWTKALTI